MTKSLKISVPSNPKVWILIGIGVAGIAVLAEAERRRRRRKRDEKLLEIEDFGAFVERFELLPFPQLPPPAAPQSLSGLTFAVKDMFVILLFNIVFLKVLKCWCVILLVSQALQWDCFCRFEIKGRVTGFGSPDWKRTHEEGSKNAVVITSLLKEGAKCVGSTVLDELSLGYALFV